MEFAVPILLAVGAGVLTTVTGIGGGQVLLICLSLLWEDPVAALTVTAPALLAGNAHRAHLFRDAVNWKIALALVAGALPGSFVGGLFVVDAPQRLLYGLMVVTTTIAVLRSLGHLRFSVSPFLFLPAGIVVGAITAGGGGAGLLVAPLLISAGLFGDRFIATSAVSSTAAHFGRLVAYGAAGLLTTTNLAWAGGLAVCITVGNVLGRGLRERLGETTTRRLEVGALVLAVALAVTGLT